MNRKEADELISLINTFVDDYGEPEEATAEEKPKKEIGADITEDNLNKLFRTKIPESFTWNNAKLVRAGCTGDKVFLQYGDERRWIPDLETLEKIGYTLGDVENISDDDIKALKEGFGLLSVKLWG